MATVFQRPAARRDLIAHYVHLSEAASQPVADRFLARAAARFEDLANQPLIGAQLNTKVSTLTGLRKWRIKDFDEYMIFYLPRSGGASIVRVLHAARDWWRLLGIVD